MGVVHAPDLNFQRFFYAGAAAEAHNKLTKFGLFVKAGSFWHRRQSRPCIRPISESFLLVRRGFQQIALQRSIQN